MTKLERPERQPDGQVHRLLEAADRAEQVGDVPGALVALRDHLAQHQNDGPSRLRYARLLLASGARAAARQALAPFETTTSDDPLTREATRRLAELDEADGAVLAAALRWEQILADDIDDPQARAKLAMLRAGTHATTPTEIDPAATLVAPDGVETSRYRLLRELGRGATAAVYLARDVGLDLEVALKVLHAQLAGAAGADARRRFFAEARLCARPAAPRRSRDLRRRRGRAPAGDGVRPRRDACATACGPTPPASHPTSATPPPARCSPPSRSCMPAASSTGTSSRRTCSYVRPGDVVLADFGAAELFLTATPRRRRSRRHAAVPGARAVRRRPLLPRHRSLRRRRRPLGSDLRPPPPLPRRPRARSPPHSPSRRRRPPGLAFPRVGRPRPDATASAEQIRSRRARHETI